MRVTVLLLLLLGTIRASLCLMLDCVQRLLRAV